MLPRESPPPTDAEPELQLGEILVKEGLVSEGQVEAALRLQATRQPRARLGEILAELGFVTRQQIDFVLDWYYRKYRLGAILIEARMITAAQLELALYHHRRTGLRLGDALRQLEFVSEEQLKRALCTQFGATYVDLDKLVIDDDVAQLVDREYAQLHRLVPITRADGTITVAVADPAGSVDLAELRTRTGSRVNVLTSTDASFQRVFARVYGESPEAGLARQLRALGDACEAIRRERDEAVAEVQALRSRMAELAEERRRATEEMERVLGRLRRLP